MDLKQAIEKAGHSAVYRTLLNWLLNRMVPFNKPHGFRVKKIDGHAIETEIPYRRSNFNHIRGLHACALATLSEFTTGLLLLYALDSRKYRLIMKKLEMEYHYQGKMDATAAYALAPDWLQKNVIEPLESQDAVVVVCEVLIHDRQGNHLTTGQVHWQIKEWGKVKTTAVRT